MTEEDKELLLSLLEKANEEDLLDIDWITPDKDLLSFDNELIIKIKEV